MSAHGKFNISGFKQLNKNMQLMQKDIDRFMHDFNTEAGALLFATLTKLSPVDTGHLRVSWELDRSGHEKGAWVTVIINALEYAYYVNYGHQQKARFVHGHWEGKRFIYDPNAKTGMQLTNKWIEGQFFVEKAIEEVEKALPALFEKRFSEFAKRYGL